MIEWSSQTDFNPALTTALQLQDIWIDGTPPSQDSGSHCPANADTWIELGRGDPAAVYAVNCIYRSYHSGGPNPLYGYYRMHDSDIFLNTDNMIFYWGTLQTIRPNARGVLTHELGHSVYLKDVYTNCGSPVITMCGVVSDAGTYGLYSLTTDDINAANSVYLP